MCQVLCLALRTVAQDNVSESVQGMLAMGAGLRSMPVLLQDCADVGGPSAKTHLCLFRICGLQTFTCIRIIGKLVLKIR